MPIEEIIFHLQIDYPDVISWGIDFTDVVETPDSFQVSVGVDLPTLRRQVII